MTKNYKTDITDGRGTAEMRGAVRVLRFAGFVLVVAVFLAALGSCGKKHKERAERVGTAEAEPRTLTIKGSDTMLPMITALAQAYVTVHPDTQISVTGGGSTVGIADIINGTIDLGMSSRIVNPEEEKRADFRRVGLQDIIVALDGVTVIVHPQNPVNELTIAQLRQIFTGKIKNWMEVGGPNQAIQPVSRDPDSGTAAFFKERVLQSENYKSGIQLAASNAAVVQSVSQELWSIGYVGFAFAEGAGVKVVGVKKNNASPAVSPSLPTVRDGSYPLERPLHIYASSKASGLALAFLEFVLSPEGRRIAREKGYVPL
jgi:phosphate transport system substrate-binding protein